MYLNDYGLQIEAFNKNLTLQVALPLNLEEVAKSFGDKAFDLRFLLHGKELFYFFVTNISSSVFYLHPKTSKQDYKIVKSVLENKEIAILLKQALASAEEDIKKLKLVLEILEFN